MRPGQLHPNELELAILERLAQDNPWLQGPFTMLHVLSRKYTGVGCYTEFLCEVLERPDDPSPGLHLEVSGVPLGMVAVLFCHGTSPKCLELCTYGSDHWDGTFESFSFPVAGS